MPPLPPHFADAYARRYLIALVLSFSRVNVPNLLHLSDLVYRLFSIPRSLSCPIFLSTRKNSFVALTKVSREKRYFDCESFFSFSFFSPFFLRSFLRSFNEHYLLNYRENRTTLESLVRTENEINAAFLERKYPGFEVIVSSKTNIREEPVLRDLLFSFFFFFFYSFFLSISISLRLQFTQQ